MASPIKYFSAFQGIVCDPRPPPSRTTLSQYVLTKLNEILKSVSLKSYGTFQPSLPYFRRSWTAAWKNASTYASVLNAEFSQLSKTSSDKRRERRLQIHL